MLELDAQKNSLDNFSMYSFLFYVFFSLFCVQKIHFFFTGCKIDMYLIFGLNESLAQVGTGGVFVRIFFFSPPKSILQTVPQCLAAGVI